MAVINITKVFDRTKAAATDAGQQLADFLQYSVEALAQVIGALRNGISFKDNVDCDIKVFNIASDSAQVVSVRKTPTGMIPIRVKSTTCTLDAFNWYFDSNSKPNVVATFKGAAATDKLDLVVIVLYGPTE